MSAAQDEIDTLFKPGNTHLRHHPEDDRPYHSGNDDDDADQAKDHASNAHQQTSNTFDPDEDEWDEEPFNESNMPSATWKLPSLVSEANTGPKGVIADARSFAQGQRRILRGRKLAKGPQSNQDFANELKHGQQRSRNSSSSHEEDFVDDDGFMEMWRKHRMSELKGSAENQRTRRLSPSKRKYGRVESVDALGYLDAIEKVSRDTIVVVCVYDDESDISGLVEDSLTTIARKHSTTRFVKLHYLEAEMDVVAVPAILAYKGGELFANLVSIIDEIPPERNLSCSSLEWVLKQ
ncbi:MAG: hypothetical protein M1829_000685 [Trizodia sp. TS-e1964]|nr:MAG: hypothetical protein M1829_000685 [Trizodia sp. TS-e1964]